MIDFLRQVEFMVLLTGARDNMKQGLAKYREVSNLVTALEYDESNPREREAVRVFYNEMESAQMGPQLTQLATELDTLFESVLEQMGTMVHSPGGSDDVLYRENADAIFDKAYDNLNDIVDRYIPLMAKCQELCVKLNAPGVPGT